MARSLVEKRPQAIRDLFEIAVYLAEESGNDDLAFSFLAHEVTRLRTSAETEGFGMTKKKRSAVIGTP